MRNCLIIDTETNGDKNNPIGIEIGWVLYSIKRKTMLNCGSFLCNSGEENKAHLINRIPSPVPKDRHSSGMAKVLKGWIEGYSIDFIVAHQKSFDREIIESVLIREDDLFYFRSTPWLCTYEDFQLFPPEYQGKRDLVSLAQFYGVGISATHRTIYDCLLIAEVFNRADDLKAHFELAVKRSEKMLIIAFLPYEEKDKAKELKLYYNKDHDCYVGTIPTCEFNESDYPFPIIAHKIHEDYDLKEVVELNTEWIIAEVSYDEKDLAKHHGFKWKNGKWVKRVPIYALKSLNFPFPIKTFSSGFTL